MAIFEVNPEKQLSSFRRVLGGTGQLYEAEIEELIWNNSEELTGEGLFPIARQPMVGGGGKPDIVALDSKARVVVIEIKRDIDRGQLAQCLEYAGWARGTNLDELSGIYHGGEEQFFNDWKEFTDGDGLRPVTRDPQLILVAREFEGRTKDALDFLTSNDTPITLVTIAVHEDQAGRRFLEVGGVAEPAGVAADGGVASDPQPDWPRITPADLIEAGLIEVDDQLVWERPQLGKSYKATITAGGEIMLEDGRTFSSPSGAACAAANIPAYNGWTAWKVVRTGKMFNDLLAEAKLAKHGHAYGTGGKKYKAMLAEIEARGSGTAGNAVS